MTYKPLGATKVATLTDGLAQAVAACAGHLVTLGITSPTVTVASLVGMRVRVVEGMTAVAPLKPMDEAVHPRRRWRDVFGIDASRIAAEMMKVATFWNRADEKLIGDTMSRDGATDFLYPEGTVSKTTEPRSFPKPTAGVQLLDLRPKASFECVSVPARHRLVKGA